MKIKKHGKNKREFKKLTADETTQIRDEKGFECKRLFESLIGYDFLCEIKNNILEVTGMDGESFFITTELEIELA